MATDSNRLEDPGLGTGVRAIIAELGRVVWPTREELLRMTMIVILTVVIIAGYIAVVDVILTEASKKIYGTGL
jgi:preprotein translocase subunit SecE